MANSDNDNPRIISLGQIEIDPGKFDARPDTEALPLLPTRNLVLFPTVATPLSLVREQSLRVAREAFEKSVPLGVVCQLDPDNENPGLDGLQPFGVVADVLKIFDLPDGQHTALIRARDKFQIVGESESVSPGNTLIARVELIKEQKPRSNDKTFGAIATAVKDMTLKMLESIDGAQDFAHNVQNYPEPVGLINLICSQAPISSEKKAALLAENSVKERARMLLLELTEFERMQQVTQKIQSIARENFEQNQRQAFLHQQMEAIRQELYGDTDDDRESLRKRSEEVAFSEAARKVFDKELDKLGRLNPQSPDYAVQFSYLETLLDLPWLKYSELNTDLELARETLDVDHYGLTKVKERILEQIAVLMNNPSGKAPILCLVGPPGVGKTSLGRSIAAALGRSYQRVSLGGLHDEAEIRGHRRTYIGAMPGRIIDAIKRAGDSNPVLLLDEVDKIGSDFKGDPSAALLEVLDPEQNCRFHDNYIDVDYDLSKVLFIATANTLSTLSQPLLDRMEIINLAGYLLEEKVEIAMRHILPTLREENNLKPKEVNVTPEAVAEIVEKYTSESGVRQLEKELSTIVRKVILAKMLGKKVPAKIGPKHLKEFLGVEKFSKDRYEGNEFAGVVTGLAWTAVGGEILFIESSLSKIKGDKLTLTGNLGNVMKESATIAFQYVKSHAAELGIAEEAFEKYQLHLHVPEGAIPKDGPSAGITMATAIASAFTQRKIRNRLAMTGEITLRGKVLPVGGIKEKILAAKRAGITDIILSSDNKKDIAEIDSVYVSGLTFHYVNTVLEVMDIALLSEKVANPIAI
ncbi:MAG: endopeptidase La [Muribaculum sp.]|nr:endopeptidase La [Muribaculum sp.]MDE6458375.1 endopeptidase La [Muribaculum sp.]